MGDEQETKGEGVDSKQEEEGDHDDRDDGEEVEPEVGTKASEVTKKPDSTVEADSEAAEGTDKDVEEETEIADSSTGPSVESEAEKEKQAGHEAKEAQVAEAMTS